MKVQECSNRTNGHGLKLPASSFLKVVQDSKLCKGVMESAEAEEGEAEVEAFCLESEIPAS